MPRQQRSKIITEIIASRFIEGVRLHLGKDLSTLSESLGYANSTTVHAFKNGKALPDFVRLSEHTAELKDSKGRSLNLHWVITGEGDPVIQKIKNRKKKFSAIDNDIINNILEMKSGTKTALSTLLQDLKSS